MAVVYSVGHGARPLDEFIAVLSSAELELLVDVRRFPGSRRHPHFAREALEHSLPQHSIRYEWRGETLGGRRKPAPDSRHPAWRNDSFRAYADFMDTTTFRSALHQLEDEASAGARLAVMCAETLWWRCHRRLIADALTVDGFEVVHLIAPDQQQPHKPNEVMRIDEHGAPVYDLGVEAQLPLTDPPGF